jgi:dUTPase
MPENEYLAIMIRSSLAVNRGLQVAQGTAVIDAKKVG